MQFQLSPTPSQRRIRRIPTIRLQTMKHVRGNCMRNCWGGGAWPGFETTRRAKLAARTARGRAATHRHTQRPDTTGVEDAGGTGGHGRASRSTTPSRQARVWRSRGRPGPTAPGTTAEPQASSSIANSGCTAGVKGVRGPGCGARNNSGATSNKLNRKFRLHRRCEGRKRAWLWRPWAAAEPGRAPSQRTEPHISDQAPLCGGRRRVRRARAGFEARRRTQ